LDSAILGVSLLAIADVSVSSLVRVLSLSGGLILFLMSFLYYSAMEGLFSTTLGKRVTKIRAVRANGDPCTIRESVLRNLFRAIDWLPFCYVLGIGFISITKKKRRVGDIIAHTIVTMAPEPDRNSPPAPFLFH
jgi:uncharacterized RDD family membrane protein YckC